MQMMGRVGLVGIGAAFLVDQSMWTPRINMRSKIGVPSGFVAWRSDNLLRNQPHGLMQTLVAWHVDHPAHVITIRRDVE